MLFATRRCWGFPPALSQGLFPSAFPAGSSRISLCRHNFPPSFPPSLPHSMTQRGLSELKNDALRSNYSGYLCHPRTCRGKSLPFPFLPPEAEAAPGPPLGAAPAPGSPWPLSPPVTVPPLPGKCHPEPPLAEQELIPPLPFPPPSTSAAKNMK